MIPARCILALDIGTSGVKSCLIDQSGKILKKETTGYAVVFSANRAEQSPQAWWKAVVDSVSQLIQSTSPEPEAIFLTGQMQSVIFIENEKVLAPAILYADTRAGKQIDEIIQFIGQDNLLELSGNLNDSSSVLAKLLWIKENEPEIYNKADHLLLAAHDFINWKLSESYVTDYTNATTTGLLDIKQNCWATDLLEKLHIRTDWLPKLAPAYQQTGTLCAGIANQLGLKEGTPVFHGAGDAASATIGSGAGEPGNFYIYLGTSGWLATTGFNEKVDPLTGIWNLRHIDPDRMIYLGPMLTTAGNWEWVNETFGELELANSKSSDSSYDLIEQLAAQSPAGSNGVFYLPMINGERAPVRDPNARAVFFGLNRTTARADLYRSVLEGVAYAMRTIREVMLSMMPADTQMKELYLTGGGARTGLWAQIFADVMNCRVKVLSSPEDVGVKGMAVVAGKALGWHDDFLPEGLFFQADAVYHPSSNAEVYRRLYEIYRQLYPSLKDVFEQSVDILAEE
jgi:xylulokinase